MFFNPSGHLIDSRLIWIYSSLFKFSKYGEIDKDSDFYVFDAMFIKRYKMLALVFIF